MDDTVRVISDTIQEFCGTRYYLCGYYFQHNGKRLHRVVWEYFNGEIPEGYHVHHLDGDRSNNDIENLALLPGLDHITAHAREESRRENGRRAIRIAIEIAPEWHHSEEGKRWHSDHSLKMWEKYKKPHEEICTGCGCTYLAYGIRHKGNHFCSNNCKARYYRRKNNADKKH